VNVHLSRANHNTEVQLVSPTPHVDMFVSIGRYRPPSGKAGGHMLNSASCLQMYFSVGTLVVQDLGALNNQGVNPRTSDAELALCSAT